MKHFTIFAFIFTVAATGLTGCSENQSPNAVIPADFVFTNGKVYTVDENRSWAEAVAVSGKNIVFVGSDEDARTYIGDQTEVVDLEGRMMLPGFADTHTHVRIGGQMNSVMLNLFAIQDGKEAVLAAIREYADTLGPDDWVLGTGWQYGDFEPNPTRQELDAVTGGRPATFSSESQHTGWYNTRALEYFGITDDTPDPPGGVIVRDENGVASGTLKEKAQIMYGASATPKLFTEEQQETALKTGINMLNELGITSLFDSAESQAGAEDVYKRVLAKGELTARADLGLVHMSPMDDSKSLETLLARKFQGDEMLKVRTIKMFVEGIPGKFSLMFEPYADGTRGTANYEPDRLNRVIDDLTENGFRIFVHCQGDAGIDMTISAFEYADRTGTPLGTDSRHVLTHLDHLRVQDIPRMKKLGLIAQIQPNWSARNTYSETIIKDQVGPERYASMYPFAELHAGGIVLAAGADWPTGPDISPWDLIQVGMTRQDVKGEMAVFPGKKLNLQTLIEAFTINGAYLLFLDKVTGSLEVGKRADLIVIDQNLFDIPVTDIHKTRVLLTTMNGAVVHRDGI